MLYIAFINSYMEAFYSLSFTIVKTLKIYTDGNQGTQEDKTIQY